MPNIQLASTFRWLRFPESLLSARPGVTSHPCLGGYSSTITNKGYIQSIDFPKHRPRDGRNDDIMKEVNQKNDSVLYAATKNINK